MFFSIRGLCKKSKKVLSKALIAACHSRAAPEGTRASWAQGQFCDCDLTNCAYCHWQTLYKGLICVLTVHVLSAGQRGSSSCRPVALPAKRDMHLEACVALLQFYLCQWLSSSKAGGILFLCVCLFWKHLCPSGTVSKARGKNVSFPFNNRVQLKLFLFFFFK